MSGASRSARRDARPAHRAPLAMSLAALIIGLGARAEGQIPPASSGHPSPPSTDPSLPAADRASVLFERGVQTFERRAFEEALDDFRASLDLYPTAQAMKNAALCLRELGRFDEALQLLETVPDSFPNLPADELRENALKIDELSMQVAWVEFRGVEPSSEVVVDGRNRGTVPPGSRLPVSSGRHRIRVLKEGMLPAEVGVAVATGQTAIADIDQRPTETSPSEPWTLSVELGGAVTPSMGGDVAGCSSPCERSLGWGGRVLARIRHAVGRRFYLSVDGGYLVLGQNVDNRLATVVAVGNLTDPGRASDELSMRGGIVGLSLAYRVPSLGESFVRAGTGSFIGWVRDARTGSFKTQDAMLPYPVSQTQLQPAYYGYISLAVDVGFRPSRAFRLGAGLDAMAMIALRQPQWDKDCAECIISGGRDGDSWFASQPIAGRFMMLVSPFINAGYVF